jgi:hypothetical protein
MSEAALLDRSSPLCASDGPLSAAAIAELRANPRFPDAIRALATGMLSLFRGNRLLNLLVNDRGRMLIGWLALYLHEGGAPDGRGSGFGVGQLKALCAAAGLASPGRTAAMLALMRMSGHIASASAPEDRRRHILVPTEKLRAQHRERWDKFVAALREVRPEAAAAFALDDPEFVAAFVRTTSDHWLRGFRLLEIAPEMELIIERNAGLMILFSVLLAGKRDDTMPPRRPVPFSISAVANRFGVSRAHVRMLLRDAETEGLIRREGPGGSHVLILPSLAEAIEIFFAAAFLFLALCAHEAHDEVYGRAARG